MASVLEAKHVDPAAPFMLVADVVDAVGFDARKITGVDGEAPVAEEDGMISNAPD
jgi:hypothetical protein